jgi:hypothetical protein
VWRKLHGCTFCPLLWVFLLRPLNSVLPRTGAMNPYQSTIAAVGGILDNYDSDKLYPVYGFGAKVRQGCESFSLLRISGRPSEWPVARAVVNPRRDSA